MEIKIYYGMSGALKGTTIESIKNKDSTVEIMESKIKKWKDYEKELFKDMIPYSDLIYSILHLTQLGDFMRIAASKRPDYALIERGVTDSLFYYYKNNPNLDYDNDFIRNVVRREWIQLLPDFFRAKRILLVQRDEEFIKTHVLKENHRNQIFPDVQTYLKNQEQYVYFTKTYNQIDEIIEITNARDYIENILDVKYKN